jgi:O-methyltransferase
MDPSRTFHLFDTFEGFKEEDLRNETGEAATYTTRNFADTSLEAVKRYLGKSGQFVFHVGRFQELDSWTVGQLDSETLGQNEVISSTVKDQEQFYDKGTTAQLSNCPTVQLQFALVNLDADLYLPTKAGLEFFYPLLSPGGVIIVHDYTHKWPGIKKAVDEFVATIPESLVMVPDMDGSVMIIRNSV